MNIESEFVVKKELEKINATSQFELEVKYNLLNYCIDASKADEFGSWVSCVLALKASAEGNFGVGAALFDCGDNLIEYSGNQVFYPRFRSDAHAEMMVVNNYEEKNISRRILHECTLYTSLECCPMCLARITTAQVGTVVYVCEDEIGGMIRKRHLLPVAWFQLQRAIVFRKANCTDVLVDIARKIFQKNAEELNLKLL